MIATLGQSLILGALVCTGAGSILAFVSAFKRSREGAIWARRAAQVFGVLLILANVLMVYALLVPDFSVGYVAKVGSTKVPTWVAVVSLWSSLEGSILFWGAMLGVFVLVVGTWHVGPGTRRRCCCCRSRPLGTRLEK